MVSVHQSEHQQFLCHLEQITLCNTLRPIFISQLNILEMNEQSIIKCNVAVFKEQALEIEAIMTERKHINLTAAFILF